MHFVSFILQIKITKVRKVRKYGERIMLGENLLRLRKLAGFSQEEIAGRIVFKFYHFYTIVS